MLMLSIDVIQGLVPSRTFNKAAECGIVQDSASPTPASPTPASPLPLFVSKEILTTAGTLGNHDRNSASASIISICEIPSWKTVGLSSDAGPGGV